MAADSHPDDKCRESTCPHCLTGLGRVVENEVGVNYQALSYVCPRCEHAWKKTYPLASFTQPSASEAVSQPSPRGWPCTQCGSVDTVCLQVSGDAIPPYCLCRTCGKAWKCDGLPPENLLETPATLV